MCRSLDYFNAAVMKGIHGGVQIIINAKNHKAIVVGCIDHSINLCTLICIIYIMCNMF